MKIIAGKFKGMSLKTPKGLNTRPTPSRLRETVFNILQHKIEGSHFLDLFAGSGVTGFEALSRGATFATFIDNSRQSVQCIKSNAEKLEISGNAQIIKSDAVRCLERYAKQNKQFDIIYADPPYGTKIPYLGNDVLLSEVILHLVDTHHLLAEGGTLFIEEGHVIDSNFNTLLHLSFQRIKNCGKATLHEFHG